MQLITSIKLSNTMGVSVPNSKKIHEYKNANNGIRSKIYMGWGIIVLLSFVFFHFLFFFPYKKNSLLHFDLPDFLLPFDNPDASTLLTYW